MRKLLYFVNMDVMNIRSVEYFWHDIDAFTMTRSNFIWTFPGEPLTDKSIAVFNGKNTYSIDELKKIGVAGVCHDYIQSFRSQWYEHK